MSVRSGKPAVLVTGASGYIGKLVTVTLLLEEDCDLLLPLRPHHNIDSVRADILTEFKTLGARVTPQLSRRMHFVPIALADDLTGLDERVKQLGVEQVVHCAACLDYFDSLELERINVGLTESLLARSKSWGIERFFYISTAFSSGYIDSPVEESLHSEPEADPTEYTRTKRQAEWLVANSGLPFVCLRPSIVIGDSRDGHYAGNRYGLYQLWSGIERLLCSRWEPEYHLVASDEPTHLVHQDAFQAAFLISFRSGNALGFLNIASAIDCLPSGKELWHMWLDGILQAERVSFYDTAEDLPVGTMCRRQRALMALASVNMEIAAHPWRFKTNMLDRFSASGVQIPQTTSRTVQRCLEAYISQSDRLQAFQRSYGRLRGKQELQQVGL